MSISETVSVSRPDQDGTVLIGVNKPEDGYWLEIAIDIKTDEYEVRMVIDGGSGEEFVPVPSTMLRLGDGPGCTTYDTVRDEMNIDPEGVVQRALQRWDEIKEHIQ